MNFRIQFLAVVALTLSSLAFLASITPVWAGAKCTAHPKNEWITEEDFKKRLVEQGYSIKVFKVSGDCYELYGKDKSGQKVEIYFDTKTGDIVKSVSR
jgi:hypothetical protein